MYTLLCEATQLFLFLLSRLNWDQLLKEKDLLLKGRPVFEGLLFVVGGKEEVIRVFCLR